MSFRHSLLHCAVTRRERAGDRPLAVITRNIAKVCPNVNRCFRGIVVASKSDSNVWRSGFVATPKRDTAAGHAALQTEHPFDLLLECLPSEE